MSVQVENSLSQFVIVEMGNNEHRKEGERTEQRGTTFSSQKIIKLI